MEIDIPENRNGREMTGVTNICTCRRHEKKWRHSKLKKQDNWETVNFGDTET